MTRLLVVVAIFAIICGVESRRRNRNEKFINGGSYDLYLTAPEICKADFETDQKLESMYECYKNMYYGVDCEDIPGAEMIEKFLKKENIDDQKVELELSFIHEMCLFGSMYFDIRLENIIDDALFTREQDLDLLPLQVQQIRRSPRAGKVERMKELISTDISVMREMWLVYS